MFVGTILYLFTEHFVSTGIQQEWAEFILILPRNAKFFRNSPVAVPDRTVLTIRLPIFFTHSWNKVKSCVKLFRIIICFFKPQFFPYVIFIKIPNHLIKMLLGLIHPGTRAKTFPKMLIIVPHITGQFKYIQLILQFLNYLWWNDLLKQRKIMFAF